MDNIYSVAIDGPAGAGKSTIAKLVAEKLNIEYIDTGAMYRALTLKVLRKNINPEESNGVISILQETDIDFINNHIFLDGEIVDKEIRENIINKNVSFIAVIREVRERMVALQRGMSDRKSVVMDGRDITTVVLPNAQFKFFVTASVEERGRRRYKELLAKGENNISLEQIIAEIIKRDNIDSSREIAPLKMSDDSILIDTTDKTIDECVNLIISIIKGGLDVL